MKKKGIGIHWDTFCWYTLQAGYFFAVIPSLNDLRWVGNSDDGNDNGNNISNGNSNDIDIDDDDIDDDDITCLQRIEQ